MQTQPQSTAHSAISSSDDDFRLYGVLANAIDLIWSEASPIIEQALAHADSKYSLEDVYGFIQSRDMQLWAIYNNKGLQGITVTQIICYPQEKRLLIVFLAGIDFDKWINLWFPMRDWAKEEGCTACEIFGRPGWERRLKEIGFEKIHTVLKVEI